MNLLKKAVCLTLTGCMIISSCCISFAETDTPRRDKDAIEVSQEELELMDSLKSERKNHTKMEADGTEKGNRLEEKETRAKIFEEAESNDTFAKADLLYYGERFKGWIDSKSDVDIFEIKFKEDGYVTFELWSIPSGCDYDLTVYDQNYDEIDWSNNSDDLDEQITIVVEAGESYYAAIESYKGYDDTDCYYVDVDYVNPAFCLSVGVDYEAKGVDTSNDADLFDYRMDKIGFITKLLTSVKSTIWDKTFLRNGGPRLLEADVLMLAGHGDSYAVYFNEENLGGKYANGVTYGNGGTVNRTLKGQTEAVFNLVGLGNYDVSDTILAVFCACSTAAGKINLTSKACTDHGINCSIGWGQNIKEDRDAEEWLDRFSFYLAKGETIRMAAYYANTEGNYIDEGTIVKTLKIITEQSNSASVSLKEYVQEAATRNTAMDNEKISKEMSELLGKNVTSEHIRELRENAIACEVFDVSETVNYSAEDKNLDEIITYIQENFDKNFDINQYEVLTDMSNIICNDEIIETSIALNLKIGDFVTTDGYYIVVKNGEVEMIFVNGDPQNNSNYPIQPRSAVDEDILKKEALDEIVLYDGEKVIEQRVLKKFDTEPYYVVMTDIVNVNDGMGRLESYEYR